MSDKVRELVEALRSQSKAHVKVQTAWVVVKSVDWNAKTMVATGVSDNLDYNDVLLGLGGVYVKPEVNSMCLIGLIENQDAAAFLIDAEKIEESLVACKKIVYNGGSNGGLVKKDVTAEKLNNLERDTNKLKSILLSWAPLAGDGGAALKTALASAGYLSGILQLTQPSQLENTEIKH